MKLVKVEITGFKSFKNTASIHFDQGITGIVGPNGCGKSNIVDAVLWACGSALASQLRGDQMADIIFAGTEKHPPAHFASAAITLEKSDTAPWPSDFKAFSQLEIKRRLTRGGESQYFINNTPCLLRNIQELLTDSGAGSWSIIEQDMITRLISSKPDQIRSVLEQTAGTARFKNKKKLAQNKLKTVTGNLERLSDILNEQKKQLNKLERQSARAKSYKELKSKIRNIEIFSIQNRFFENQNQIKAKDNEINSLNAKLDTAKTKLSRLQSHYKKTGKNFEETYRQIGSQRNLTAKHLQDINEYEINIQKLKTLIDSKTQNQQRWTSDLTSFKEFNSKKSRQIAGLKEQVQQDKKHITAVEKDFKSKKNEFETNQLELSLMKKNQHLAEAKLHQYSKEESAKEENLKNILAEQEKTAQHITAAATELKTKELKCQSLKNSCRKIENTRAEEQKLHLDLEEEINCLSHNVSSLESSKKKSEAQLHELKILLAKKESKQKSFAELKEKTASPLTCRQQLKKALGGAGSIPALVDFLKVESSFELCAEAFLDRLFYSFIAEDENQALAMIKTAEKEGLGQVFCLIAKNLKNNTAPLVSQDKKNQSSLYKEPGFICFLKDKIKIHSSAPYIENILSLVDSAVVVESAEAIKNFSSKYPCFTFMTKKGEILKQGLIFSRGANLKELNPLIMDKEIQALETQTAEIKNNIAQTENQIEISTQKLKNLNTQRTKLKAKEEEKDKIVFSKEKELLTLKSALNFVSEDLKSAYSSIQKLKQNQDRLGAEKKNTAAVLKQLKQKTALEEQSLTALKTKLSLQEALVQKLKISVEEAQFSLMSAKKDLKNKELKIDVLTQALEEMTQKESEFLQKSNSDQETVKQSAVQLKELKVQLEAKKTIYKKESAKQKDLENTYQEKTSGWRGFEEQLESLNSLIAGTSEEKHKIELEKEALFIEQKNIEEKAEENYQLDISSFLELKPSPVAEEEKSNSYLMSIKSKLQGIGQVNLLALSEFNEVKKENEELKRQYDDLYQSKEELEQVIQEMDQISNKKFKDTYEEANKRFSQIFSSVFNGGSAQLILTNEKEPGVEILACPPGKKLKNLKLLSGGEKSLTALSLIFSLFLVRPAPFCVLDEVDAALDDANVIRFNSLISEMAKQRQVILITHNKHSMKECRRLYGVTMEEKGVTGLVSVNMKHQPPEQLST